MTFLKPHTTTDWIEHDGKEMPVDPSTPVIVKFKDFYDSAVPFSANSWDWKWKIAATDIIAYKIVTEK